MIMECELVPSVFGVRPGDPATWVDLDIAPHTATARDKGWGTARLDTDHERTGEVKTGMATGYCRAFHPRMKGKSRIVEA